jgi:hypothetical protein
LVLLNFLGNLLQVPQLAGVGHPGTYVVCKW